MQIRYIKENTQKHTIQGGKQAIWLEVRRDVQNRGNILWS